MKTIFSTRTLFRTPLALSLLAAAALAQPAHAGLLGGAGGGFAGQGAFGPRTLDVGAAGSAAGSLQRTTPQPPKPATAVQGGAAASHDEHGTAAGAGAEASRGERSVGAGAAAQTTR